MNHNPSIIVDDDKDDLEILQDAFAELNVQNEILFFSEGAAFLQYMQETAQKTFFILCDINMVPLNGLELKGKIQEDDRLRLKCVPFVFYSTSGATSSILRAYSYNTQGYFIKPHDRAEIKEMLLSIMAYWSKSQHPNV